MNTNDVNVLLYHVNININANQMKGMNEDDRNKLKCYSK